MPRLKRHAVGAAPAAADATVAPVATAALAPAPTAKPAPMRAPQCAVGHPVGMVLGIVGINAGDCGRCCKEHTVCGTVLKKNIVLGLRKEQIVVPDPSAGGVVHA
jgi:hypothetical protein